MIGALDLIIYRFAVRHALFEDAEIDASSSVTRKVNWRAENPKSFVSIRQGVGHGEEMLAWELNGIIKGPNASYDVVDKDGMKWEVKMPNDRNEIRAAIEGIRAFSPERMQIEEVAKQILTAFGDATIRERLSTILDEKEKETLAKIKRFVEMDVEAIVERGVISGGRMLGGTYKSPIGLLQVLQFARNIIDRLTLDTKKRRLVYAGKERDIDAITHINIGKLLGLTDDEIGADFSERFVGTLVHWAFKRPDEFVRKVWIEFIPSRAFPGVDGLALVDSTGYTLLTMRDVDRAMRLAGTTQGGKPLFKITLS